MESDIIIQIQQYDSSKQSTVLCVFALSYLHFVHINMFNKYKNTNNVKNNNEVLFREHVTHNDCFALHRLLVRMRNFQMMKNS